MGRRPHRYANEPNALLVGASTLLADAHVIRAAKAPRYERPRQRWGKIEFVQTALAHLHLASDANLSRLTVEVNAWLAQCPDARRIGDVSRKTVSRALHTFHLANS
jgi:hypothetical protein